MNNFNLTLKKAYKNYLRLKGSGEITKQMINDYYQIKKEYIIFPKNIFKNNLIKYKLYKNNFSL